MTEFEFLLPEVQKLKVGDILKNEIITDIWYSIDGERQYSSKKLSRNRLIKYFQKWFYKNF
jgi:hypothetical protein